MKSTFLSLNAKDFIKGLIMAVGTPVLYLVQELIPNWPLSPIEKAAASATVTYLLKNLFTDTNKEAVSTIVNNGGSVIAPPEQTK